MTWKPAGYSALSPYIVATDAPALVEFCQRVFAAELLQRFDRPDGTIMHAELRLDDGVLMVADATAEWPPQPAVLHLYVPDVAVTYQRALAAGATSLRAPERKDDPDRRGGVRDPAGNDWWLATREG